MRADPAGWGYISWFRCELRKRSTAETASSGSGSTDDRRRQNQPHQFRHGVRPCSPCPFICLPVQVVLLEEKQTESNGNRSGWSCCLLPDQRPVSPPTRSDAPHRYLHHTAGRSPGQDGTRCLFPQDIHSSSSVFLLRYPNTCHFLMVYEAACPLALLSSVVSCSDIFLPGECKQTKTKRHLLMRRYIVNISRQ